MDDFLNDLKYLAEKTNKGDSHGSYEEPVKKEGYKDNNLEELTEEGKEELEEYIKYIMDKENEMDKKIKDDLRQSEYNPKKGFLEKILNNGYLKGFFGNILNTPYIKEAMMGVLVVIVLVICNRVLFPMLYTAMEMIKEVIPMALGILIVYFVYKLFVGDKGNPSGKKPSSSPPSVGSTIGVQKKQSLPKEKNIYATNSRNRNRNRM